MNPAKAAQNRTARLVREATTPVYSTSTPVREHLTVVEWDDDTHRWWTAPMPDSEVDGYIERTIAQHNGNIGLSDIDHAAKCWCQK
jgi:hypothetical protein